VNFLRRFKCSRCEVDIIFVRDDLGKFPQCPKCGKSWCPNYSVHGHAELQERENSRGKYHFCPVCHWYSSIDYESNKSAVTQQIFAEQLMEILAKEFSKEDFSFKSTLAGEEPWFNLEERLKKYGRIRTSDLELLYKKKTVTKFELKGWMNYDTKKFYFTGRANVNTDEVKDAAKFDGYVCFVTWNDKKVMCTMAQDILSEWEKQRVKIPCGPEIADENESKKARALVTKELKRTMVIIGPDYQNNCRFILSREYKRKYCKYIQDYSSELLIRVKSVS